MSRNKTILILLALVILFAGCSKEKKDEAAKLEQELLGDSMKKVDSIIVDSAAELVQDSVSEFEVTAVPAEEQPKMMPKKPAGEGYTVQVAGCEDLAYAESLVERYTKRGYQPYVTTGTVEGQTYYRVRIGIFESLSDAKALQLELHDRFSVGTWVDVTTNSY